MGSYVDRTNKIHIKYHRYNGSIKKCPMLYSSSKFFSEPIVIKVQEDKLILRHSTIDDNKDYTFRLIGRQYESRLIGYELPEGEFEFDEEESNEDIKVIYFKKDD